MPEFIDLPPERDPLLRLFVWIGVRANGQEAMLSADMPMPFGARHSPLMSSRRDVAEKLELLARRIQHEARRGANPIVKVELRTFVAAPGAPSPFKCPRCGAVSHHPKDIGERYCARCHAFVDEVWPGF